MTKEYRLGLFMGRFQPFHNGHMYALRKAYLMCDKVIIGIGSAQESGTDKNPIDAKNRISIIKSSLKGSGMPLSKFIFFKVPDFNDNDAWYRYIVKAYPRIDAVFSKNSVVKKIFKEHKISVISPSWQNRKEFQATVIRSKIKKGMPWKSSVPYGAVKEIEANKDSIKGRREYGVVIGGTFAYLHKGHKHLLKKAFDVGDHVYIGLCTDKYASKVKMRKTVPTYSVRKKALTSFIKKFGKRFDIAPLKDKFGPSTTGNYDAIVVSKDTLPVARQINVIRKQRGLKMLKIFTVGLILANDSKPISTTRIVNGEIDRHGRVL